MKKIFFLPLLLLSVIFIPTTIKADELAIPNRFCQFYPAGNIGAPTGDVTLNSDCVIYEAMNGVSVGNLTVDGSAVSLHKTLTFDPGKQIDIVNGGIIWINTNGTIQQAKLCIGDFDNDNYADIETVTLDPNTGEPFKNGENIYQIKYALADLTTNTCASGYTLRENMNNLALVDSNSNLASPLYLGSSDNELLRLGFTIGGVTDALAAAGDVQLIDRNLFTCSGSCPASGFGATYGNIYTAGKIGIGVTNPSIALQVSGAGSFSSGLNSTSIGQSAAAAGTFTTLSSTGVTTIGDASADTVTVNSNAWTFANDTNVTLTGGVNGLSFDTSTLTIDSTNDRVGIGLTNPSYKLHVSTATYDESNPVFAVNNTAASQYGNWFPLFGGLASGAGNGAQVQMLYGVAAANANRVEETFTYVSSGSNSNMLSLGFYGNNFPFNILYSGNVGIGTTTPLSTLHVNGSSRFSGSLINTGVSYASAAFNSIGDQYSMVPNAGFEVNDDATTTIADGWFLNTNTTGTNPSVTTTSVQGVRGQTLYGTSTTNSSLLSTCFPVTGGNAYNLYAWVKSSAASSGDGLILRIFAYDDGGCTTSGASYDAVANGAVTSTWTKYGATVTLAASKRSAIVMIYNNAPNTTNTMTFDSVTVVPSAVTSTIDLAENYYSSDTLQAGQVVATDTNLISGVTTAKLDNQDTLLGVVSTNPAITLGELITSPDKHITKVALTGRVPVITSTHQGPIYIGDHLTSSSIPGVAAKSIQSGLTLGTALEPSTRWSAATCSPVSDIVNISWAADDGSDTQVRPCFRLPDGTFIGKLMTYVNLTWFEPKTSAISAQIKNHEDRLELLEKDNQKLNSKVLELEKQINTLIHK